MIAERPTEQRQVYINAGPAVAFRAPGYVEAAFGLESAMDERAVKLGMDPLELRRRNYAQIDPVKSQAWSSPDALRQCYARLEKAVNWPVKVDKPASEHCRRGVGVAAHEWVAGTGSPPAYAYLKINADASVDVITGAQDIGTGSRTVLALVAAEALRVAVDTVRVRLGDTAAGPYAPTSAGSFTTPTLAPAVQAAALDARGQILAIAAERLQTDAASLTLQEGFIYRASEWGADWPEALSSVAEIAQELAPRMLQGHGSRHANSQGYTIRTFGAQFAEVEVDVLSGEITLIRIVSAPDCGRILNPRLAYSQVIGGVTQGIGYALSEERVMDATLGIVLNANLEDYLIPTAADIPAIEHAEVGLPDLKANPVGAKGPGRAADDPDSRRHCQRHS